MKTERMCKATYTYGTRYCSLSSIFFWVFSFCFLIFFHTKYKIFQRLLQSHIDKSHFWETIGRTLLPQDLLYLLIIALVISSHFIYLNKKKSKSLSRISLTTEDNRRWISLWLNKKWSNILQDDLLLLSVGVQFNWGTITMILILHLILHLILWNMLNLQFRQFSYCLSRCHFNKQKEITKQSSA